MTLPTIEAGFRALLLHRNPTLLPGIDAGRQLMYRQLVRSSLIGTLAAACPHALRLDPVLFGELAALFLESAPPTTRLVRDVPDQFSSWLMRQDPSTLPAAARSGAFAELCHFEALEIEVTLAQTAETQRSAPVTDDDVPVVDPSVRLASYRHAVHRVNPRSTELPPPSLQPVMLLCFQCAEQFVVETISPALGKLLLLFSQGQRMGAAVNTLIAEAQGADLICDEGLLRAAVVSLQRRGALTV